MENQGQPIAVTTTANVTFVTQGPFPQASQQNQPLSIAVLQDSNSAGAIAAMEEELSLWIIRIISYFFTTLLLYVNLEYRIPLEALFSIPIGLDSLLLAYYMRQHASPTYFVSIITSFLHSLESNEKYYCLLEAVQCGMTLFFKVSLYLRLSIGGWNYSWSCFILLAALIARIVLVNSFADEVNTPSALLKTFTRLFLLALICSVCLKLDGLSELSWSSVFWY